jgi:hypothetical protein
MLCPSVFIDIKTGLDQIRNFILARPATSEGLSVYYLGKN